VKRFLSTIFSLFLTVAKITACLLIVSCLVHTASAAALPTQMQTAKKNSLKKNANDQKMFRKDDMDAWKNPCGADGYNEGRTVFNRVDAYEEVSCRLGVQCENFVYFSRISGLLFFPFLFLLPLTVFSLFTDQKKRRRSQSRVEASRQNQHHKHNTF
jgi:Ni/Co efflux regulator RcnB